MAMKKNNIEFVCYHILMANKQMTIYVWKKKKKHFPQETIWLFHIAMEKYGKMAIDDFWWLLIKHGDNL